jgi:hypothetical protein
METARLSGSRYVAKAKKTRATREKPALERRISEKFKSH